MSEIFNDRERAESFGAAAQRYDRLRPGYPAELVDWLTEAGAGRAVDVGCGTGQLTRRLQDAGWDVIGVEIDDRMAAVAASHGVAVDVSRFEAWDGVGPFDLITSAQAWHWIDPSVGYAKAHGLLRPGGRLALIWNSYHYDPSVIDVFVDVIGRHAPDLLDYSVPVGVSSPDYEQLDANTIAGLGSLFGPLETVSFDHQRTQSVANWLDEMGTHSPVARLDAQLRSALDAELVDRLTEATGGELLVRYRARVTSALHV
jgi:SAM-dependent methyltransferase